MTKTQTPIRTRWAAIGAAIAVTIGGGGIGIANATLNSGERTAFVPIEPCRLLDTRSPNNIGPKSSPLGAGEQHTVDSHGEQGNCDITKAATGLVLNVTALNATEVTNVRVFSADATLPTTSNLNPSPGAPPAPNSVTTDIDRDGKFVIYNAFGSVNVIADVVGYYEDHNHDDRYYTRDQADRAFTPLAAQLVIPGGSITPLLSDIDFNRTSGYFGFGTSGSEQCATAAADIPNGATVTDVGIRYLSVGPVEFRGGLGGSTYTAGEAAVGDPIAAIQATALPITAPTIGEVAIPVTNTDPIDRTTHNTGMQFCVDGSVVIVAIVIDYKPG